MNEGISIIVCIKQVPDPEGPSSAFQVDTEAKKVTPKGLSPVISPFDENALEAALRMKESYGGKITVLSLGQKLAPRVLIKALAAGADEMILVQDASFEDLDSNGTANCLAAAIKKIGKFDLVLCGRQAADTNQGQVGLLIADGLDIPAVTLAQKIELVDGGLKVEQTLPDGYNTSEVQMPALLTVSSDYYESRSPGIPAMMAAKKKPVTTWNAGDIGVDASQGRRNKVIAIRPRVSGIQCEIISGATPEDAGINLAVKLKEVGVF